MKEHTNNKWNYENPLKIARADARTENERKMKCPKIKSQLSLRSKVKTCFRFDFDFVLAFDFDTDYNCIFELIPVFDLVSLSRLMLPKPKNAE